MGQVSQKYENTAYTALIPESNLQLPVVASMAKDRLKPAHSPGLNIQINCKYLLCLVE